MTIKFDDATATCHLQRRRLPKRHGGRRALGLGEGDKLRQGPRKQIIRAQDQDIVPGANLVEPQEQVWQRPTPCLWRGASVINDLEVDRPCGVPGPKLFEEAVIGDQDDSRKSLDGSQGFHDHI